MVDRWPDGREAFIRSTKRQDHSLPLFLVFTAILEKHLVELDLMSGIISQAQLAFLKMMKDMKDITKNY